MENDLSLSQAFGGLRIANPDREPSPASPTETSFNAPPSATKLTPIDCPPQFRRISLFNIPFFSRGSSSSDFTSVRSHSQNLDYQSPHEFTEGDSSESLKSPRSAERRLEMTKTHRQSLPNNYKSHQNSQVSFQDSISAQNRYRQHLTDETSQMASVAQARNSVNFSSTEELNSQGSVRDSLLSYNPGIINQDDIQEKMATQSDCTTLRDLGLAERSYFQYKPSSAESRPLPTQTCLRGTRGSYYERVSSHADGTTPRYEHEASNTSNGVDWKDKGAAVGVREEYDVNGKPVLRQVKKGVSDFLFGHILGEGSYSQVVLGTDKKTLKKYAVKILDKKHIIKEKKVKYVNIEKDTLNRLIEHPGIVRLYYTFQDSTSLYYVLDIASGGELLGVLKKIGSFNEECTKFYGAQILDAIEHMHNRGVIHRDLKPENVLMDDQMHIKITDFGTAKLLPDPRKNPSLTNGYASSADSEESMRAKSFVGTAEYVSPELLTEKSACKASDLWAFGCIIYQLLAGRPPFKAGNDYQTFQKIVNLEFEYPPGFPRTARDLVDRLLVLDPQRRLTIEHIKSHPFFEGIQWGQGLWKQKGPRLKPYIPPPEEPNIIRLNSHHSIICPTDNTRAQQSSPQINHTRPQPRVITELPPPTQLDIEWSPVLTRYNERILKLGNLTVISSPLPLSPHSRLGDHVDGHEKRKLSRFFGGTNTKKKQRLVMITSSGRIILAAAGSEEKKTKKDISILASDFSWRTQVDSKGHETWCVQNNGMHYTFDDTKTSMSTGEPSRGSAQEWVESIKRAKEIALSRSMNESYNMETGFEVASPASSPSGTAFSGGNHAESISVNDRPSRGHLTKNQTQFVGEDAEKPVKKSRFSRRQSKNGLSVPF
ncbi:hypothetical protein Golomagni_00868 [Golovinomyces magnicellulatus]|nr:hypothetical protein Golomagni_00868 [Golovinomyces magnicellulatus]